jgi:hypothetical protein
MAFSYLQRMTCTGLDEHEFVDTDQFCGSAQ